MIRDKALRISTTVNWCVLSILMTAIALLGQFGIIANEISRYIRNCCLLANFYCNYANHLQMVKQKILIHHTGI